MGIIPEKTLTGIIEDLQSWVPLHNWQYARFTGTMTCEDCGLLPLDEDDTETECEANQLDPNVVEIVRASDLGNAALPKDDIDYAAVTIEVTYNDAGNGALYGVADDGSVSLWQN